MSNKNKFYLILTLTAFIVVVLLFFFHYKTLILNQSPTENAVQFKLSREANTPFDLIDPEQAPNEIKEAVMLGYNIMLNTHHYAKGYALDRISCTNCHFAGGSTTGGKNGGISLAGVAATYPQFNERSQKIEDLPARINNCFERSLNGKALPLDSKEMIALVTYFQWISKGMPIYKDVPWLGLQMLKTNHTPNAENGKTVYFQNCASCHGNEGKGDIHDQIPPLWGDLAFNDGAGMNNESILASFIYWNMPYTSPSLTEEEALDVASFITKQPRPHFRKVDE